MILYNVILICNLILEFINKKRENKYHISEKIIILILGVLSAARSINIGNDTATYYDIFFRVQNTDIGNLFSEFSLRWEMGFIYFIKLISNFVESPQSLLIISSVFIYYVLYKYITKYSSNIFLSCFLFITMRYYFFFLSNIRQSIAICIIIIAFDLLNKDKTIKFIGAVVMAFFFHSTAIVFLLALFIKKITFSKMKIILIILCSFVIMVYFDKIYAAVNFILPYKYQNYINTSYYLDANNLANILNCIVYLFLFLLCFIFFKSKSKNEKFSDSYCFNILFPLISFVLSMLSIKFGMISKIQYYFSFFLIIIIPNLINNMSYDQNKKIISFLVIILFFFYHILILFFRPEWQHVYPYEFFWEASS